MGIYAFPTDPSEVAIQRPHSTMPATLYTPSIVIFLRDCYSGTNKKTRKTRRARAVPPFYLYFVNAEHRNDIPGLRDEREFERKVPQIKGEEPRQIPAMIMSSNTSSSITISHLFDSLDTMSNSTG